MYRNILNTLLRLLIYLLGAFFSENVVVIVCPYVLKAKNMFILL